MGTKRAIDRHVEGGKPFTPKQRKQWATEQKKRRQHEAERDATYLGTPSIPLVAFGEHSLREAYRIWWQPYLNRDFDKLCKRGRSHVHLFVGTRGFTAHAGPEHWLDTVASGASLEVETLEPAHARRMAEAAQRFNDSPVVVRRGGARTRPRKPEEMYAPDRSYSSAKVKITLRTPVQTPVTTIVTIDRRYPGEIFALMHDFYRRLCTRMGTKNNTMKGVTSARPWHVWEHDPALLFLRDIRYKATPKDADGCEGVFLFGIQHP